MWAIIVAFLVALLSGMGVGSAGLLVVWLCAFEGIPQLAAQGMNLYFFLFSSAASLCVHIKRRKILWGMLIFMLPFGIAGAIAGSLLAARVPEGLLSRLFGGMLVVSGGLALLKSVCHIKHKVSAK